MHQQANLYFYKFRFLFAGVTAIAFLMLISAIVTAVGSDTILNTKTHPDTSFVTNTGVSDGPDVITNGVSALAGDTQGFLVSIGTTSYSTCRSINTLSDQSGKATLQLSADIIGGVWNGMSLISHGVGDSVMFTLRSTGDIITYTARTPNKVVGSITSGHAVSDIIKPTDDSTAAPIISDQTSSAALAKLSAAQQQEIASLQAAQLAANQSLDGNAIAGNSDHGGYPTKWDDAPQDSMLDSWGMYNRECVSYAAWKVYQTYGSMPYWGGVGNANQWVGDAIRAGIPTGSTPQVHSVAIWRVGYYGHAMWVEKVDGNMIYVSQYNYDLRGHYSEMWVNGSNFTYIYFK